MQKYKAAPQWATATSELFGLGRGRFVFCIWAISISVSQEVQVRSSKQLLSRQGRTWCLPKKLVFTLTYNGGFES